MREKERRGEETKEQREDRQQQMSLHSTAPQSVHHTFSKAPPRLNTYLWLPTLLTQARPTNVLHFTSIILTKHNGSRTLYIVIIQ